VIELRNHPYFLATQFHPEFKSRPLRPSPPYLGLLKAAVAHTEGIVERVKER